MSEPSVIFSTSNVEAILAFQACQYFQSDKLLGCPKIPAPRLGVCISLLVSIGLLPEVGRCVYCEALYRAARNES